MKDYFNQISENLLYARDEQRAIFVSILATLSNIDKSIKKEEKIFLEDLSQKLGMKFHPHFLQYTTQACIKNASILKGSPISLELIKDMFALAYTDNEFTTQEAQFIYDIGKAMQVPTTKLKQISRWIADRIIWLEQGALIFNDIPAKPKTSKKPKSGTTKATKTLTKTKSSTTKNAKTSTQTSPKKVKKTK